MPVLYVMHSATVRSVYARPVFRSKTDDIFIKTAQKMQINIVIFRASVFDNQVYSVDIFSGIPKQRNKTQGRLIGFAESIDDHIHFGVPHCLFPCVTVKNQ